MVLAALASQHVPPDEPIDLINVSFADSSFSSDFDKVPDRQNGINGYDLSPSSFSVPLLLLPLFSFFSPMSHAPTSPPELLPTLFFIPSSSFSPLLVLRHLFRLYELQKISTTRQWNLVKVNINHDHLQFACKHNVYPLTYPATTIMGKPLCLPLLFPPFSLFLSPPFLFFFAPLVRIPPLPFFSPLPPLAVFLFLPSPPLPLSPSPLSPLPSPLSPLPSPLSPLPSPLSPLPSPLSPLPSPLSPLPSPLSPTLFSF